MKKLFAIALVAVAFAACNNEAKTDAATEDSLRAAATADSLKAIEAQAAADTLNKKADSLGNKADSLVDKADSSKKAI